MPPPIGFVQPPLPYTHDLFEGESVQRCLVDLLARESKDELADYERCLRAPSESVLVGDANRDPVEREVARGRTRHIDHADPEVGVGEVADGPASTPGVGRAAQGAR